MRVTLDEFCIGRSSGKSGGFWVTDIYEDEQRIVAAAYCAPEPFTNAAWNLYFFFSTVVIGTATHVPMSRVLRHPPHQRRRDIVRALPFPGLLWMHDKILESSYGKSPVSSQVSRVYEPDGRVEMRQPTINHPARYRGFAWYFHTRKRIHSYTQILLEQTLQYALDSDCTSTGSGARVECAVCHMRTMSMRMARGKIMRGSRGGGTVGAVGEYSEMEHCSTCNALIQKIVGCNQIICSCGTEFCYTCGEKFAKNGRGCACSIHPRHGAGNS